MFIAREEELRILEETYNKSGFQMTVIYGRRRIGKSTLISEFIKDKESSYYMASQSSLEDNLSKWTEQYINDIAPEMEGVTFKDIENFFRFICNNARDKRIIIALDEIPYIAEADETFLSRFQRIIDTMLSKTNIYLILCGSAISFMEREVLSEKSPLFGRRTNQIFLKPFNYKDSAKFVPNYNNEEKAIVYGLTGGVAKYLCLFDDSISLDENIIKNFFTSSGYLYEEPMNLLRQEFRTINTYNAVIEACALGANKVNEIADKTHTTTAALAYIINGLMTVGILSKITAITEEKNKKKVSYEIADGMYKFWYKFIPSARAAIEMGKGDVYYHANVKNEIHDYMGKIFEKMCQYYTLEQGITGKLKFLVTNVGTWWGNGHDRVPTDIDVVGINKATHEALLGECKFKNEALGKEVYEGLTARSGLIDSKFKEVQLIMFSLSGFTKWVEENVDESTLLVTLEDMYT